MHEISQNCVYNAPKSPQSPLEEFVRSPKLLVDWRGGKSIPSPDLPLNDFGVSLRRLRRLKSNVPLPKQFSGSAPVSCDSMSMHRDLHLGLQPLSDTRR